MKATIPDFLIEMSQQMNTDPNRSTPHPYWQVRCKRWLPAPEGYSSDHYVLVDDDGEFFNSRTGDCENTALLERHPCFAGEWIKENERDFVPNFNIDTDELPEGVTKIWLQEVEEVVSTHLTQHDAEWFINRKQHDYPQLYTYVESAYWSPQLKQLQDWIKSLTQDKGGM